jgi:hypothetical protein
MLVATFGPSTAWQGREIIWDADHFILVGHGAITAAGVLDYDRRGQLVWADPALRSWAFEIDLWENGGRSSLGSAAGASAPPGAGTAVAAAGPAKPARRGIPTWVIVVIVVAVLALIAAIAAAVILPSLISRTTETLAQDLTVSANIYNLQMGIEAYAAGHAGRFPDPTEMNPVGMSGYVTAWPVNPYTDQPMGDGGGEGNFRYDVSPDGGAYKLIGYGGGGKTVFEVSGGDETTV